MVMQQKVINLKESVQRAVSRHINGKFNGRRKKVVVGLRSGEFAPNDQTENFPKNLKQLSLCASPLFLKIP